MCGIAGIVGGPDRAIVERMASAMVHRGPDDDGFYVDADVALGFRRLAIIDIAGGQQPLSNEDGSIHVVFNGEIYNHRELRAGLEKRGHRLRTSTDGEVLAHLYEERGADLVDDLNGIFAFAIWDAPNHRIVLARDGHGVKPLYYTERDGRFLFASEIKALVASRAVSKELDPEAVRQYLIYQAVPPPLTMLSDVRALPPGAVLVKNGGPAEVRSYWTPQPEAAAVTTSVDEARVIVRDGLQAAVKRQMMSERPLGVFLSGGVDSSALVALAAQEVSHKLKTFSVGFVGADEQVLTEWPWARLVAERYDTDHHEVVLSEEMFRERLPHVLHAMDQPTSDGINSYYVSYAAAQQVTVALSGTGGDELFLGYDRDLRLLAQYEDGARLRPLPAGYVRWVSRLLDRAPDESVWRSAQRVKQIARAYAGLDAELVSPRGIGIFEETEIDKVLVAGHQRGRPGAEYLRDDVAPDPLRPGDWLSRVEQRAYLSYVLLRDIDAMSMAHSLEVRVPFLDAEFAKSLERIPWQWKLRDGVGKWILKRAVEDLLPAEILTRPKMGFGLPYNIWMRRSLEPIVRDTLSPDRLRRRGVFDVAQATSLVDRFYAGDEGVWRRVWTLFVLEGWASHTLD